MAAATSSSGTTRVAVAQMTSTNDHAHNLNTTRTLARSARDRGASLLFLPECVAFLGNSRDETRAAAERFDAVVDTYASLAKELGLWLCLGGVQERSHVPSKVHNTQLLISDRGSIEARYRKIHLFDVDVPNGPVLRESEYTEPGADLVVASVPNGPNIGLSTCYDLRFPDLYQRLRFDYGADVLTVPSAFTKPTGEAHWEVLLRARAIETQCYVIAAAQAGRHSERRESYGHALIVDPWGAVVGRCDDPDGTDIAVADLDLELVQRIRQKMPIGQHRRDLSEAAKRGA